MKTDPKNEGYFAPPAEPLALDEQAVPVTWGEDAEEIARLASLGSYSPEVLDQQVREDTLIRGLERMDGEIRGLRRVVGIMGVWLVGLAWVVGWLWLRGKH
jgi:hypothetical protein